jgi:hypothetical protein
MKLRSLYSVAATMTLALTVGFHAHAAPFDLTGQNYVTYGDANSYALAVLAFQYNQQFGGGVGPGNPFFVASSPGAIKDLVVVATGASGGPVNTNFAGMDNALSTPTGVSGSNFFSGTWNSTLAAFTSYLGGNDPIFFFNNNQTNSGATTNQNLAAFATLSVTGTAVPTLFFDLTNIDSKYALVGDGGGGVVNGSVVPYTSTGAPPDAGTNLATDYVLSGGQICLNGSFLPVSCSGAHVYGPINNNLGANQAAYALDVPEFNDFLAAWIGGFLPGYTDLHLTLFLGCDPGTVGTSGGTAGVGDCVGRDLNNGYEQVFIATAINVPPTNDVPEPATLPLIGLALLGLYGLTRKQKQP